MVPPDPALHGCDVHTGAGPLPLPAFSGLSVMEELASTYRTALPEIPPLAAAQSHWDLPSLAGATSHRLPQMKNSLVVPHCIRRSPNFVSTIENPISGFCIAIFAVRLLNLHDITVASRTLEGRGGRSPRCGDGHTDEDGAFIERPALGGPCLRLWAIAKPWPEQE